MMTILAIPSMCFFYYGNEVKDIQLVQLVSAASLGNLGSSQTTCDLSTLPITTEIQFDLSCAFGELWSVETFGQLSTFE